MKLLQNNIYLLNYMLKFILMNNKDLQNFTIYKLALNFYMGMYSALNDR